MAIIRDIVDDFPFLAMDTEFPGIVRSPLRRSCRAPTVGATLLVAAGASGPAQCAARGRLCFCSEHIGVWAWGEGGAGSCAADIAT